MTSIKNAEIIFFDKMPDFYLFSTFFYTFLPYSTVFYIFPYIVKIFSYFFTLYLDKRKFLCYNDIAEGKNSNSEDGIHAVILFGALYPERATPAQENTI